MQTIFARTALTPEGWRNDVRVSIDGEGRIADVEANARSEGGHHAAVLLPAAANLHSHTFQRAMAGLAEARGPAERDSFWTWRETMYRFLDMLSPDDVEAVAALAFMEMQESGFTAVAEFHYLHHRPGGAPYDDVAELAARIAAAAGETGIGLTLLPVLYRHGGVDGRPLAGGQLRFANDIDGFSSLLAGAETALAPLPGDTRLGVAPHSLRAANGEDIAAALTMRPDSPVHMHIAEQEAEIEEMRAVHGARPVAWLLDNFDVDARWCLIHCTHMVPAETEALARSGAVAGLCPVTEANLGDGIFDGARFAAAGGTLGVGTDSNIRISLAEELRQLEYAQRLGERARIVMAGAGQSAGRTLYDAALAGGARALKRDAGEVAPGRLADLVALDPQAGGFGHLDGDRLVDAFVFTSGREAVREVWSAGRHVVTNGRHRARETIARRYERTLARLMERL